MTSWADMEDMAAEGKVTPEAENSTGGADDDDEVAFPMTSFALDELVPVTVRVGPVPVEADEYEIVVE